MTDYHAKYYLEREGLAGGVYVRVGSTNRRADRELVEELRRFARGESYDEQPMPGLDSEALDFRAASESFAAPAAPATTSSIRTTTPKASRRTWSTPARWTPRAGSSGRTLGNGPRSPRSLTNSGQLNIAYRILRTILDNGIPDLVEK